MLAHIPHPSEEGDKADCNQQFVDEEAQERNDFEKPFKYIAQEIPHHSSAFYTTKIGNDRIQAQSKFAYF